MAEPLRTSVEPEPDAIRVTGARVHNLKNISFEIPHNAITVVTGVSGSGKSSLAFDTIYAEGQRRYIESLSAYARQFLERIEKPDVDEISGIAPAIAIKQKNSTRNPRSTVATATEIYDYLRLLFARAGRTFCTRCGSRSAPRHAGRNCRARPGVRAGPALLRAVSPALPETPARKPARTQSRRSPAPEPRCSRRSPICRSADSTASIRTAACTNSLPPETLLDVDFAQPVFVLVDRLAIAPDIRSRLADSIEICYRDGRAKPFWISASGRPTENAQPAHAARSG